jgi:hypothetical protein
LRAVTTAHTIANRSSTAAAQVLRLLADEVERGQPLPPELEKAVTDALEDREDLAALREWRDAQKRGEKTIPSADAYRKVGL